MESTGEKCRSFFRVGQKAPLRGDIMESYKISLKNHIAN
jgi:hypothetical protein